MISFVPGNSWRTIHYPDGRIETWWVDPPLYGTSLTAVKPREGIIIAKDEKDKQMPVVYLQWDTHTLAEGQGPSMSVFPDVEYAILNVHRDSAYTRPRGIPTFPTYESYNCG
jgi:hypothetical protein